MVGDLAASLGSAQEFHDGSDGKESSCNAGDTGSIPGSRISLEKEMTTHSSILAWEIPWTEEPGKSMGSQRVRHDWVTNTFTFASNACCPFCYLNSIYFSKFTSSPTFLMKLSLITHLLIRSSFPLHVLFHTTFIFFLPCVLIPPLQLYLHSLKVRTMSTTSTYFPKVPSPSSKELYLLISLIKNICIPGYYVCHFLCLMGMFQEYHK